MPIKKTVLASTILLLPLLANAHPGEHAHVGDTGMHVGISPLIVGASVVFLILFAIRKCLTSQSIERTRD